MAVTDTTWTMPPYSTHATPSPISITCSAPTTKAVQHPADDDDDDEDDSPDLRRCRGLLLGVFSSDVEAEAVTSVPPGLPRLPCCVFVALLLDFFDLRTFLEADAPPPDLLLRAFEVRDSMGDTQLLIVSVGWYWLLAVRSCRHGSGDVRVQLPTTHRGGGGDMDWCW